MGRLTLLLLFCLSLGACSTTRELGLGCREITAEPESHPLEPVSKDVNFHNPPSIRETAEKSPEELKAELNNYGRRWLYGHGMGQTITNVGGIVIFPPYAIYLVGNAIVSLAGYEPLHVTELLPEKACLGYNSFYDNVTAIPGRISAEIAGEEFIEK